MIYLKPNQINEVNVTLWENCTDPTKPYFTWKLVNKQSLQETIFTNDDLSQAPYYYNTYQITVTTPIGLTAGKIDINPGEYTYTIYQMPTPYDLNLSNAITQVETGLLIYNATFSNNPVYTQNDSSTIVVYNNMDRI